jgi:hypothetical protein
VLSQHEQTVAAMPAKGLIQPSTMLMVNPASTRAFPPSTINQAYDALSSVVAGAFLLWVGASFLLMNAVADFAKTKRERVRHGVGQ